MRTVVRITPDIEKGNAAIASGTMQKVIANTIDQLKPEASYFFADNGKRSAFFVFDLKDQSDIPVIAEPWFTQMNATVEFYPCMNAQDLEKALNRLETTRPQYAGA